MDTKGKKLKNILSWVFILVFAILVAIPTTRIEIQRGLLSIGLLNPKVPSIADAEKNAAKAGDSTAWIQVSDDEGNRIDTRSLKGKVVFINFWATWCGPCRVEMPSIQKLYNKFKDNDQVVFLLVETDHNIEGVKTYLNEEKLDLPIYYPESNIPKTWFSGLLPTTVVVNKKGLTVFHHENMADYSTKKFEDFLISLINQK